MDPKTANIISRVLGTLGVILMLAMAFHVTGLGANTLIFSGIVCFIPAGLVSGLAEDEPKSPGNPPDNE